jgi:hypothetical protein
MKRKRQVYNQTPYGFQRDGRNLVCDEIEQRVLGQVFGWRKSGDSLWTIASRLNDLGIRAKKGGKWHCETIRSILRNDLYREFQPNNVIEMPIPKRNGTPAEPAEAKLMTELMNGIRGMGERDEIR